MELRTTFKIEPSEHRISYADPVMFIGSCFAGTIGQQFELGHMPVMINPAGAVYNPVSVCNTLDSITSGKKYGSSDLYNHEGTWISFDHYTDFSSGDAEEILNKINRRSAEALKFISSAKYLFVTFGTARVYRWILSGKIVSNCHKIPESYFNHELLTVEDITILWVNQLDKLKSLFPDLKVIFTISPVRHLKDGAHRNQVSKAVLFLVVEKLLGHPVKPAYFPAYELVMDDLRDYRFYEDDMLHPSTLATDYIWDAFCGSYFDEDTKNLWKEAAKISKAVSHRIQHNSSYETKKFAKNMISRIDSITERHPYINLETEWQYFHKLI
jgi:hypothetical protein